MLLEEESPSAKTKQIEFPMKMTLAESTESLSEYFRKV